VVKLDYLFTDPRPDFTQDSVTWNRLLELIPSLDDKHIAQLLQKRLWTLRSAGVMLKPNGSGGLKFVAAIGNRCDFASEAEFEEIKKKYLSPYANEISELLRKVLSHEADNQT
jgi:hypothetical protein